MQLDVNQPIYTGGRLRNAYGIQASALDALEAAARAGAPGAAVSGRRDLLRGADERAGRARRRRADRAGRAGSWSWRRRGSRPARVARLDVLQAEVELANAKARRIQAKAAVDTSHQALRTVLSLPQSQPLQLRGTLDERRRADGREALARRAPVAARPSRLRRAARHGRSTSVALANAEWKPSLALDRQPAVPGGRPRQTCCRPTTRATRSGSRCACRSSRRRGAAPSAASRRRRSVRPSTGSAPRLDAAGSSSNRRGRDLEAADEVVATQQKALELARESVVDRAGVLRERRDHVGRAERRAGARCSRPSGS